MAQPAFKRVRVDEEGSELGAPGRGRMQNVSIENKVKAIRFIYELAKDLYAAMETTFPEARNHNAVFDAATCNLIYNLHQAKRQEMNEGSGSAKTKFASNAGLSIEVHSSSHTFTNDQLKGFYNRAMNTVKFKKDNYATWGGNVQTILTILACFGERLREVRIMPVGIVTSKRTVGETVETHVMDFKRMGIKPQHRQFCSGAGFKPFVKSGIAQSLGPLTQVAMLSLSPDDRYARKWVAAVCRTLGYVPDIESVARLLRTGRTGANQGIVSHLANILMIAGGREQRRMTPPLSAFMAYLTRKPKDKPAGFDPKKAEELDFSGKGAFSFYKWLMNSDLLYTLNINNAAITRQLLFHAMFGTYVEDFGILTFMTGSTSWMKRSEMNDAFITMKASSPILEGAKHVGVLPIVNYSKMASS
nr:nucleoprotein [Granville quaranjavirus]